MRLAPVALAAALLLALAGCVPSEPHSSPSSSSSATPVFASDADALKAAEAAYAAYESAVDTSLRSGSAAGLGLVATGDALKTAQESVASFVNEGRKQVGASKVSRMSPADLSALTAPGEPGSIAQIYACLDVSGVTVVDGTGASVSTPDRKTVFPTLVSVVWIPGSQVLLVSEESVWDGKNFCV